MKQPTFCGRELLSLSVIEAARAGDLCNCHIFASAPLMSSMSCAYTVPVLLIRRAI